MNSVADTLISYEDMLKAGMHFGRKKTVFHPGMDRYVFAVRDGICILDLLKTQEELNKVIETVRQLMAEQKLILFVAPTKQSQESIQALAESLGMPYVVDRWLGGTLSNFKVINTRVKRLEELERQKAAGELDKYTKKERLLIERELVTMHKRFHGLKKLNRLPDMVFVGSVKEGALPIHEAMLLKIPCIGVANTDANPKGMAHVIPANDRSKVAVDLIVNRIREALVG